MSRNRVVIFIFLSSGKILIEKRALKHFDGEQYLIPGGSVKEDLESLEDALKREMMEELGVTPLDFLPLPYNGDIKGLHGQQLVPYIINKWEGNFPETILDKGNSLVWLGLDEVLATPVKPTRAIIEALKKYLQTR